MLIEEQTKLPIKHPRNAARRRPVKTEKDCTKRPISRSRHSRDRKVHHRYRETAPFITRQYAIRICRRQRNCLTGRHNAKFLDPAFNQALCKLARDDQSMKKLTFFCDKYVPNDVSQLLRHFGRPSQQTADRKSDISGAKYPAPSILADSERYVRKGRVSDSNIYSFWHQRQSSMSMCRYISKIVDPCQMHSWVTKFARQYSLYINCVVGKPLRTDGSQGSQVLSRDI